MAKDPAFLFYSSDFLTGTMMMTDTEVGQYIRLLCYQHQAGHFDATAMQRLCGGNATASLAAKFKIDSDGLYYNERLEEEVIKRKKHSEKQRDNANKRWQSNGNATAMPLEDENVIEDVIEVKKEKRKGVVGEKQKPSEFIPPHWDKNKFNELWAEFVEMRTKKKKPLTANAVKRRVLELVSVSGGSFDVAVKIALRTIDKGYDEFYKIEDNRQAHKPEEGRYAHERVTIRDKA